MVGIYYGTVHREIKKLAAPICLFVGGILITNYNSMHSGVISISTMYIILILDLALLLNNNLSHDLGYCQGFGHCLCLHVIATWNLEWPNLLKMLLLCCLPIHLSFKVIWIILLEELLVILFGIYIHMTQ